MEENMREFKVYYRPRPLSNMEVNSKATQVVEVVSDTQAKLEGESHVYEFDRVFAPTTDQLTFCSELATDDLVDRFFNNSDVWVFNYGHTATGGSYSLVGTKDEPGLIPYLMQQIFDYLNSSSDENLSEWQIQSSFYEIYSDKIYDLAKGDQIPLKLVTDSTSKTYPKEISYDQYQDFESMNSKFNEGLKNRFGYPPASMNALADRSNLVYTIQLLNGENVTSELRFVVICGPEKLSHSGASETTMKEIKSINTAFSSLNQVIEDSIKSEKSASFRQNNLTRILQSSFLRKTTTRMIMTSSTSDRYIKETTRTLQYGLKAMEIG